jgi:hypothetical protein
VAPRRRRRGRAPSRGGRAHCGGVAFLARATTSPRAAPPAAPAPVEPITRRRSPVDAKVAERCNDRRPKLQQKSATRAVNPRARSKRANWPSSLHVAVPAKATCSREPSPRRHRAERPAWARWGRAQTALAAHRAAAPGSVGSPRRASRQVVASRCCSSSHGRTSASTSGPIPSLTAGSARSRNSA